MIEPKCSLVISQVANGFTVTPHIEGDMVCLDDVAVFTSTYELSGFLDNHFDNNPKFAVKDEVAL